jgi:CRISPR-associated protein Cas5h
MHTASTGSKPKVIVFDVWAPFAYFRKPFTTTSALSFNFIPRSAIEGLIGTLLGIRRNDIFGALANAAIAVEILTEIKKIPFSINHTHSDFWNTINQYLNGDPTNKKKAFNARTTMELLVDPKYRIYFCDTSNLNRRSLNQQLEHALKNHRTVYTPYLGTSSMIAIASYLDTYDYDTVDKNIAEISNIIPYNGNLPDIVIEKDRTYAVEQNIPARLNQDRELMSSFSAVYNPNGKSMKVRNIKVNSFDRNGIEVNFVTLPS